MKQSFSSQDISEKRRKILNIQKESEFVWIRATAAKACNIACRNSELQAKQCRLQHRWENLN
jgi:hypothetical protein